MARPLILVLVAFILGSGEPRVWSRFSPSEPNAMAVPESRIRQVSLANTTTAPGETQVLHSTLHNPLGELMILTLSVTYADGRQQSVVESALAGTATLSWTVPADVAPGIARYRLTAGGCGCGMGDYGLAQPALESSAEGTFVID